MSTLDLSALFADQLEWHWTHQLRARLDGLTDDEYFWEPVADCWNVRPRGTGTAPIQAGSGAMTVDFAFPAPEPAPVTTIAWRLGRRRVPARPFESPAARTARRLSPLSWPWRWRARSPCRRRSRRARRRRPLPPARQRARRTTRPR